MTSLVFNAHSQRSSQTVIQNGGGRCIFGSNIQCVMGSCSFERLGQRKGYAAMCFKNQKVGYFLAVSMFLYDENLLGLDASAETLLLNKFFLEL